MDRGITHGEREIADSSNGLHTAHEAEKNSCDAAAPAARGSPALQAALKQGGSVEPQVNQKCNRANDSG